MRTAPSLTVFSGAKLVTPLSPKIPRIGQSIPIVKIKSAIFSRIGETVLRRTQKKFALKIQRVTID
jgi:hypothetical protein